MLENNTSDLTHWMEQEFSIFDIHPDVPEPEAVHLRNCYACNTVFDEKEAVKSRVSYGWFRNQQGPIGSGYKCPQCGRDLLDWYIKIDILGIQEVEAARTRFGDWKNHEDL